MRAGNVNKATEEDPYCKLLYHNSKIIKKETKHISKTSFPEYCETFSEEVNFLQQGPVPTIRLEIWDHNMLKDKIMCQGLIDVTPAFEKSSTWDLNGFYQLESEMTKALISQPMQTSRDQIPDSPWVYIIATFVPEGGTENSEHPKDIEGKIAMSEFDKVNGMIKVRVVHARDLIVADRKSSDPYTIISYPDGKETKTSVISSCLNPIWNETLEHKIKIAKEVPKFC